MGLMSNSSSHKLSRHNIKGLLKIAMCIIQLFLFSFDTLVPLGGVLLTGGGGFSFRKGSHRGASNPMW